MSKEEKINYILPEFMWFSRNEILIRFYKAYPFIMKDKTKIYSFFGVCANAIWNGGGTIYWYKNISVKEMIKIRDFYNKNDIKITFTFTNQLITEEHLYDEYCNQMLKIFHNGMNEVLVVSPILEKYIRENYPKYKINRSIINTEKVPYLLGDYHLSVLSKFKNKDFDFLKSLSKEEISRTEILCDEFCVNNCPYAYEHYKEHAYIQLHGRKPKGVGENYGSCRFSENGFEFLKKRLFKSIYRITYDDIINTYLPLGFKYFKLSGRGLNNTSTLLQFMKYLIKDKYQKDVLVYIAERMIMEYKIDLFNEFSTEIGTTRIDQVDFKYV